MKIRILILMFLVAGSINAQNKIIVVIDGFEEQKGQMMIALFDEANFLKKPIASKVEKIEYETITVVFEDVAQGEYVISVFQDENMNYRLDLGEYGIPTEKYGFSNNTQKLAGPPTFKDYKIAVNENEVTIKITLEKAIIPPKTTN